MKQLFDLTFTKNKEHLIIELDQDVNYLLTKFRNIICTNGINLLPKEETKKEKKVMKRCDTTINCEIPPLKKKKHPFSKRVGSVTDVMVQFYRAKIALADECEERKEFTNIEIAGDDQLCEGCNVALYFMSVLSCPLCDSRMLKNSRILQNLTGPQHTNLLKK